MLVYECTKCSKIFRFSSMPGPSESRCVKCRGQLIWTSQEKSTVRPGLHQKKEKKKMKVDWGPVLHVANSLITSLNTGKRWVGTKTAREVYERRATRI